MISAAGVAQMLTTMRLVSTSSFSCQCYLAIAARQTSPFLCLTMNEHNGYYNVLIAGFLIHSSKMCFIKPNHNVPTRNSTKSKQREERTHLTETSLLEISARSQEITCENTVSLHQAQIYCQATYSFFFPHENCHSGFLLLYINIDKSLQNNSKVCFLVQAVFVMTKKKKKKNHSHFVSATISWLKLGYVSVTV